MLKSYEHDPLAFSGLLVILELTLKARGVPVLLSEAITIDEIGHILVSSKHTVSQSAISRTNIVTGTATPMVTTEAGSRACKPARTVGSTPRRWATMALKPEVFSRLSKSWDKCRKAWSDTQGYVSM